MGIKAYSCKPKMAASRGGPKKVGTAHNASFGRDFLDQLKKRQSTAGEGSALEGEIDRRNAFGNQKPTRAERVARGMGVSNATIAKVRGMHKRKNIDSRRFR